MKEKRNFFIKLVIEKKDDGKLIGLSKQQGLEIDFSGGEGKIIGKKNEVVLEFEKDGKNFQVLMKVDKIKKGWFKDRIIGCTFEPLPSENFILYEPDFYNTNFLGQTKKYSYNTIEPTQWRKSGFVLIGLGKDYSLDKIINSPYDQWWLRDQQFTVDFEPPGIWLD